MRHAVSGFMLNDGDYLPIHTTFTPYTSRQCFQPQAARRDDPVATSFNNTKSRILPRQRAHPSGRGVESTKPNDCFANRTTHEPRPTQRAQKKKTGEPRPREKHDDRQDTASSSRTASELALNGRDLLREAAGPA